MDIAPVPPAPAEEPGSPLTAPYTAIVIPVREAETIVRSRAIQVQPELLPRDRSVAAHITLLAPFYPAAQIDDGVLHHLEGFFGDLTPFGFELSEVCVFPSGITYLAPEPAAPFRRITQELHHAFPEFPPYGGAFDEIVPHLTVPMPDDTDPDALRRELSGALPLSAHAVEATLVHVEEEDTHVIVTLPFGVSAA